MTKFLICRFDESVAQIDEFQIFQAVIFNEFTHQNVDILKECDQVVVFKRISENTSIFAGEIKTDM